MEAGKLCLVDAPGRTGDISETAQGSTDGGYSWILKPLDQSTAAVAEGTSDERYVDYHYGRAAWTVTTEEEHATITDSGEIRTQVEDRRYHESGEFLYVPGEIAVVSDPDIIWLLEKATGTTIEVADINLTAFVRDHPNADHQQANFAGRPVQNGGTKGALYGKKLTQDPDLGDLLTKAPLPDLGVEYDYRGATSRLHAYLAASGYVTAYEEDWSSTQYIGWLLDDIVPHCRDVLADEGDACDDCGRESNSLREFDDGTVLCPTCLDKRDEEGQLPGEQQPLGGDA